MPAMEQAGPKVVNAILGRRPEYIRIIDWEGKMLTFILADEVRLEEGPGLGVAEEEQTTLS